MGDQLKFPSVSGEDEASALSGFLLQLISLLDPEMRSWSALSSNGRIIPELLSAIDLLANEEDSRGVGASGLGSLYRIATCLIEERSVFVGSNE